jgi:gluconokinase
MVSLVTRTAAADYDGGAADPQAQTDRECVRERVDVIVVVMGVAGSGKTTIGELLADAIPCEFLEGDSLHPRASVEKMSQGIPLTDADRAPWLAAIHA